MPRGKCIFNKYLQQAYPFLKQAEDASHLHCLECGSHFSISNGGKSDIRSHIKSKKHLKSIGATFPTENNSNFLIALSKKERKPKDIEMCRICSQYTNASSASNLFNKDQQNLLVQIKDLTDCSLRNESDLPKYICRDCIEDLQKAHSFRTRCLDTQLYFSSIEYKERFNQMCSASIYRANEPREMRTEEVEKVLIADREEPYLTDPDEKDMLDISNESEDKSFSDLSLIKSELECLADINVEGINENNNYTDSEKPSKNDPNVNDLKEKLDLTEVAVEKDMVEIFIEREQKALNNLECLPDINIKAINEINTDTDSEKPSKNVSSLDSLKKNADFICDRCGNCFTSRQHFNIHLRRHSNNKPFKCEVCPKQCFTSSEMKRHMRRHTGEKPFACQYCQRRFSDYSTRLKHERTHTNERPYSCLQCKKTFKISDALRKHSVVHTGERAFKCLQCNKAFTTQTNLVVHCRSIIHRQMLEKLEIKKVKLSGCLDDKKNYKSTQ